MVRELHQDLLEEDLQDLLINLNIFNEENIQNSFSCFINSLFVYLIEIKNISI